MRHNARYPHMRITPVTAMIHVIMSVILITFVSATYVFVHLHTLLVMATAIFSRRLVLYFLTHIRGFSIPVQMLSYTLFASQ